ncbi:MAG: YbjN domain-containing protein [Symbiopectobacterium sp.]
MDSLIVPDLNMLRRLVGSTQYSLHFECDSCQALHLPHMQNFDGIFDDAKVHLMDGVVLFSELAKTKPSALISLAGNLSQINASSLTVKAFLDVQDDNLPKLIVCQTLDVAAGVIIEQFRHFMQQSEKQISMVILEACANNMLFLVKKNLSCVRTLSHSLH